MNTMNKLQEIFRDVFDDPNLLITETTSPDDIADWDSLQHINLIVSCETGFKMKFPLDKLVTMRTAKDLADAIDEQRGNISG